MSRITDDMLERAVDVYGPGARAGCLRQAIEAVADELTVPGPFVLSGEEREAYKALKQRGSYDRGDVQAIIDRALRTLGPQPAQGGEWTLEDARSFYDTLGRITQYEPSHDQGDVLDALNECFPRGKPVVQELNDAGGEWTADEVLRDIACYVSAGGYNAPTVDPELFRRKIRDGIDHEVDFWRKRAEQAELQLKLGLSAPVPANEPDPVKARDEEIADILLEYTDLRDATVCAFREQCERAERERVLDEIDACLVCRAIDSDANVLDALGQVIAKLRQP